MRPERKRAFYAFLGIGYLADACAAVLGFVWRRYVQFWNAVLGDAPGIPIRTVGGRFVWDPRAGAISIVRPWGGYFLDYGGAAYHAKHPAFGAVGDNTNDDTTALQLWLNAVVTSSTTKKGFLNDGKYKVTNDLTITDLGSNRKYHVILEGAGAPDFCYDGNPDPTEIGGSVISFTATDGSHALSMTLSGAASGLPGVTLRNIGFVHATESASSGDGLRFVGDEANARQIRVNLENVAVRGFKGGSGVHMQFCMNTGCMNLTANRNKYGLTMTNASNANNVHNLVAQYNTDNGLRLLNDITSFHVYGGLIQHNPKNGVYIEGAENVSLNGVHFEGNNVTAPNNFHALHIKGSNGKYNSRIKIDSCQFADPTNEKIHIEGHASGTTESVVFIATRSRVSVGNSVTIADANCYYTIFITDPGGTVSDAGIGTLFLSRQGFMELSEIGDPAAAGTNKARLYTKDNGAGKTQVVARFATGAVQVMATEP